MRMLAASNMNKKLGLCNGLELQSCLPVSVNHSRNSRHGDELQLAPSLYLDTCFSATHRLSHLAALAQQVFVPALAVPCSLLEQLLLSSAAKQGLPAASSLTIPSRQQTAVAPAGWLHKVLAALDSHLQSPQV